MSSIYTVTAFESASKARVWGWYPTFEEAERHVLQGDDLLLESGTFKILLIEEVPVGCPTLTDHRWWYYAEFNSEQDYKVEPCAVPRWAENCANFSMG